MASAAIIDFMGSWVKCGIEIGSYDAINSVRYNVGETSGNLFVIFSIR